MANSAILARCNVPTLSGAYVERAISRASASWLPSRDTTTSLRGFSSPRHQEHCSPLPLHRSKPIQCDSIEAGRPRSRTVTAASAAAASTPASEPNKGNPFSALIDFFSSIWEEYIISPLGNFGFGKKSIWEGGVGLFLLTGLFLIGLTINWIKGVQVRSSTTRYKAVMEFSQACGITVGTPVRIRGVDVGSVVGVRPSLERIDAVVEILDCNVVIPRNSLIEVNQTGLISETLIDITPMPPMPEPTVGPLDPKCSEEGLIVCDRERIEGQQGVSLDELIANWTKIAKDVDKEGVGTMFAAMDKFAALAEEARPLLEKVNALMTDIEPMLQDVREGDLLKNLEQLTKVASEAASDLRQLNSSILTKENTELLRQSVSTLTKTLKHVEGISADISSLTGDPSTRDHLRQIIESLSRLVAD